MSLNDANEGLPAASVRLARKAAAPQRDPKPQYVQLDEPAAAVRPDLHQLALANLACSAAHSVQPISLLDWKRQRPELADVADDVWLMFAAVKLKAQGLCVEFVMCEEPDPFPVNERFCDVRVSGQLT